MIFCLVLEKKYIFEKVKIEDFPKIPLRALSELQPLRRKNESDFSKKVDGNQR